MHFVVVDTHRFVKISSLNYRRCCIVILFLFSFFFFFFFFFK